MKKDYSALESITTPEIQTEINGKEIVFVGNLQYIEADDELLPIARWIKSNVDHNSEINPEKIKFLYTTKPKKDGGRYVLGNLMLRSEVEKMVNDDYDYILPIHYKSWKELDLENKIIQLDKILCGVEVDYLEGKTKKKAIDSKEYINNLHFYGAEKVINSSEMVDMTIHRIVSEEKEDKKIQK
jgi:hypothetical protein